MPLVLDVDGTISRNYHDEEYADETGISTFRSSSPSSTRSRSKPASKSQWLISWLAIQNDIDGLVNGKRLRGTFLRHLHPLDRLANVRLAQP